MQGEKDVENRVWNAHFRGRFWVHAGAYRWPRDADWKDLLFGVDDVPDQDELPRGAILGTVKLVDVVHGYESVWAEPGNYWHWILANPEPLAEPILGVKGRQGWWEFDEQTQP
jgi:hypothetical protein